MAFSCDADTLEAFAAVMRGMSEDDRNYANTYLLAIAAGVDPDPDAILAAAACFRCVPEQKLKEMQAYLTCIAAGGVTPPAGDCGNLEGAGDPT